MAFYGNNTSNKVLSVFSLVMINVIAVDSLRTLPISAEYGLSAVFYYTLAAVIFFIPVALVAAELATGWPTTGGIYVWTREAFGKRFGFLIIWLQWIYNVVWYPTIMAFIASTLAYLIEPSLATNKVYLLTVILALFWGSTFVNCFGMKISSWVSTIGAIVGTIIPMMLIIVLGILWILQGNPLQISLNTSALLPHLTHPQNLVLFIGILFGLLGLEMSAVHAGDVQTPKRDYPRALLYSALLIYFSLVLSSLAIAIVIPQNQLSLLTGLIDAFTFFFNAFHLSWMTPLIICAMILGSLSGVAAWVIGPTKGLMVASADGNLPKMFSHTNRYGAPITILITQAILFTLLCSVFVIFPTINASYWILSAMCAQLALLVYVGMFAAAIKLRYSQPDRPRGFQIPGGFFGIWLVAGIGFLTCIGAIFIGFFPPSQFQIGNHTLYEGILIAGMIVCCGFPWLLTCKRCNGG